MLKISMVADMHHFSKTLSDSGRAYRLRAGSDQKCLEETGSIIDSAFEKIAKSDCDIVLIAGDMSNDGEKVSHEEVREKMIELQKSKPVFAVYATHDWCCDGNAKRYEGDEFFTDVETMTSPLLREFYKDFGVNRSYSEFITHLGSSSYAVKLNENVRLLGVNDDQDGKGHSGYADDHFQWILEQINDAKKNGETVILMQHHLLLTNISPLVNGGQIIGEHDERAEALAAAGVDFVIVGHSHFQRTTQHKAKNGNVLTQINLGSLCGHPAPITTITIDENEYRIDVEYLDKFTYDGIELSGEYITEHSKGLIMNVLNADTKEEFIARMGALGVKSSALDKYYKFIAKGVKFIKTATVGKAARLVNALTFGRGVSKKAVKQVKNELLLDYIMTIFLGIFDGSVTSFPPGTPVYTIVHDISTLPARASKALPVKALKKEKIQNIFKQIEIIAEELVNPSAPDNRHLVIKR